MSLRFLLALGLALSILSGCSGALPAAAQAPRPILSSFMQAVLTHEFGEYEDLVTWQELLYSLETADVVCLGEAHYDARDMETAFELARQLAQRRPIALAVERFAYDLQPALDRLRLEDGTGEREARMKAVLQDKEYRTVWGVEPFPTSGYPTNTPSLPIFEAMMEWAATERIPVIALDVTLEDRKNGLGENLPYRNVVWKNQVEKFLANHSGEKYLVVTIGGINHMDNAPASFPSQMKSTGRRVISLGQRDAMYQFRSSLLVQDLAKRERLNDLVVRHPAQAITNTKGVPLFAAPPDYWIAAHVAAPAE